MLPIRPVKLVGTESVNELFNYCIIVKTPSKNNLSMALQDACASADLTSWLGKSIQVALQLDGKNIELTDVVDTIRRKWSEHVGRGTRYSKIGLKKADKSFIKI